jgi:hypothetical protein
MAISHGEMDLGAGGWGGDGHRSCHSVSEEKFDSAVEADVRQGLEAARCVDLRDRRAKADEAVIGLAFRDRQRIAAENRAGIGRQ